jgi:hypothetical protein
MIALDPGKAILRTFQSVHPMPGCSAGVPDDLDARLVVLGVEQAYSRNAANAAETAAKAIFETRGSAPRIYRNTIVFLAADKTRLQDLDEAVRKFLAWQSVLDSRAEQLRENIRNPADLICRP